MEPDHIIIGAGSAGSVIANRLSADPGRTVLLLEAGGGHRHPFVMAPAGMMYVLSNPKFDWGFRTEPDPTRADTVEHWPRGKLLGGSSSTNGMIYVRGQPQDYDDWAAAGATGWSFADVLPYFRRMETTALGADGVRGRTGPLNVAESWAPGATEMFLAACEDAGIPRNRDYNGLDQAGAGIVQATIRNGLRHGTATAYLDPARKRRNLEVRTHARVERILIEGGRAVGVQFSRGGASHIMRCRRSVILSGGAISSPHLLMLSGIGPGADLAAHGIDVRRDLPGVGANLRDHVNFIQQRSVNIPTLNTQTGGMKVAGHVVRWLFTRSGPVASAGAHCLAFVSTDGSPRPDIQLHFSALSYAFENGVVSLAKKDGVTIIANVCRPKSSGRVGLRSADPADAPVIAPRMLSEAADLATLARGARLAKDILASPRFGDISAGDVQAQPEDEAGWQARIRAAATVTYHPAGTCKMGTDDMAVVDPDLRVRGVDALYVADASVFPSMVSGNTNAAAIMVGEKASDLIAADRPNRGQ